MSRTLTIEPADSELAVDRYPDSGSSYRVSFYAWDGKNRHELGRVFNWNSGGVRESDAFTPTERSDWTIETIEHAIQRVIERYHALELDDVDAITNLEIEEKRPFIEQEYESSKQELQRIGVHPDGDSDE